MSVSHWRNVELAPNVWGQLKNLTADTLCAALEKDGWTVDMAHGAARVYRHYNGRRVAIHYHSGKTFGPKLLRALIGDIGWSVEDMRRLKLVR